MVGTSLQPSPNSNTNAVRRSWNISRTSARPPAGGLNSALYRERPSGVENFTACFCAAAVASATAAAAAAAAALVLPPLPPSLPLDFIFCRSWLSRA